MPTINSKELDRLAKLVQSLAGFVSDLMAEGTDTPPHLREQVEAKVSQRQCLECGDIVPAGERYVRGLDASCRQNLHNLIKKGDLTMTDLILAGRILPESSGGGRKPKHKIDVDSIKAIAAGAFALVRRTAAAPVRPAVSSGFASASFAAGRTSFRLPLRSPRYVRNGTSPCDSSHNRAL